MFKREIKINFKGFIIWTSIMLLLFLVAYLVYPFIINSDSVQSMDEMIQMFPKELLKAFNMDITSIDTVFGWLKTEGFVFVLLITGAYSGILGSTILLKEENDKTIEYLHGVPVTRRKIIMDKVICGLIYIALMVLSVGIFNFIGLSISGDFDKSSYILLSITPIFSSTTIFALCLFLSTFFHKTKKTIGISLGIVFASYFFNMISEMSKNTEFLKYISVFTLADTRNVITETSIHPLMILLSVVLSTLFIILSIQHYDKKELI